MKIYYINQFPNPPLAVPIDADPPPCLMCGMPVSAPSMGGPLVCVPCDLGVNTDGSRWTAAQFRDRQARSRVQIARYRAIAEESARAEASSPGNKGCER